MRAPSRSAPKPTWSTPIRSTRYAEVLDDARDGRRGIVATVAQKADGEVHADNPTGVTDGVQLTVGQIPRGGRERVRVGVARDQRRGAQLRDVPEAFFVHVRQVHQDAELVAGAHQRLAGVRQSGPGVGRMGKQKWDAFAEIVGPTPHRTERPQAGGVEDFQHVQLGVDRLRRLRSG